MNNQEGNIATKKRGIIYISFFLIISGVSLGKNWGIRGVDFTSYQAQKNRPETCKGKRVKLKERKGEGIVVKRGVLGEKEVLPGKVH